jgi:hypothetical protein
MRSKVGVVEKLEPNALLELVEKQEGPLSIELEDRPSRSSRIAR